MQNEEKKQVKRDTKVFEVMNKARQLMSRKLIIRSDQYEDGCSDSENQPVHNHNRSMLNIEIDQTANTASSPNRDDLKTVYKCEQKIELHKITLAKREDFNLFEVYRMYFDRDSKGYVTEDDFKYAFTEFDV